MGGRSIIINHPKAPRETWQKVKCAQAALPHRNNSRFRQEQSLVSIEGRREHVAERQ
jgi:hypothetical protein